MVDTYTEPNVHCTVGAGDSDTVRGWSHDPGLEVGYGGEARETRAHAGRGAAAGENPFHLVSHLVWPDRGGAHRLLQEWSGIYGCDTPPRGSEGVDGSGDGK